MVSAEAENRPVPEDVAAAADEIIGAAGSVIDGKAEIARLVPPETGLLMTGSVPAMASSPRRSAPRQRGVFVAIALNEGLLALVRDDDVQGRRHQHSA